MFSLEEISQQDGGVLVSYIPSEGPSLENWNLTLIKPPNGHFQKPNGAWRLLRCLRLHCSKGSSQLLIIGGVGPSEVLLAVNSHSNKCIAAKQGFTILLIARGGVLS